MQRKCSPHYAITPAPSQLLFCPAQSTRETFPQEPQGRPGGAEIFIKLGFTGRSPNGPWTASGDLGAGGAHHPNLSGRSPQGSCEHGRDILSTWPPMCQVLLPCHLQVAGAKTNRATPELSQPCQAFPTINRPTGEILPWRDKDADGPSSQGVASSRSMSGGEESSGGLGGLSSPTRRVRSLNSVTSAKP